MIKLYKISLLIFSLLSCNKIFAQPPISDGEQQIKYYLDQIQYWRYQYSPEDSGVNPDASPKDSLVAANNALLNYLLQNPSLLRMEFKTLADADIKIATSADKKLRIYSWDTETGDEMHIYNAVAQYESRNGLKAQPIHDISIKNGDPTPGSLYTEVYNVGNNYLLVGSAIRSQKDAFKAVYAYTIDGNMKTANIFPGNSLTYTYDYYSNYDYKSMKEKNVPHMEKGRLYIPEVQDDKVTGQWKVYEFDGNQFKAK